MAPLPPLATPMIWKLPVYILAIPQQGHCCSDNAALPRANHIESRTTDPPQNSNRDSPFEQVHSVILVTISAVIIFICNSFCFSLCWPYDFPPSQAQDELQRGIPATETLGPFVAAATKGEVESSTLCTTAIKIPRSARFTLPLLLRT